MAEKVKTEYPHPGILHTNDITYSITISILHLRENRKICTILEMFLSKIVSIIWAIELFLTPSPIEVVTMDSQWSIVNEA